MDAITRERMQNQVGKQLVRDKTERMDKKIDADRELLREHAEKF